MRYGLFITVALCFALPCNSETISHHWAEKSLKAAVQTGVQQAFEKVEADAKYPDTTRQDIENRVVDALLERLIKQIRQFESVSDGSYNIVKEFVTFSMSSAVKMSRWTTEMMLQNFETVVAETRQKLADLRSSAEKAVSNSSQAREIFLDYEKIVAEIVANLLQDESFVKLIDTLEKIPALIHGIADDLLKGKTFKEIFELLGSGPLKRFENAVEAMLWNELAMAVNPSVDPSLGQSAQGSAFGLTQAGMQKAQPILDIIIKAHREIVRQRSEALSILVETLQKESSFIPREVVDYIKKSAVEMLN